MKKESEPPNAQEKAGIALHVYSICDDIHGEPGRATAYIVLCAMTGSPLKATCPPKESATP